MGKEKTVKIFSRGWSQDFNPAEQPEGTYRDLLNMIQSSIGGDIYSLVTEKGTKEILDSLNEYKVNTRVEIKAIKDSLIKLEKLSEREISVKEHKEKQRFA